MKKTTLIIMIIVTISCSLYFLVPVTNIKNVDYILKTQKESANFITGKTDYEIKVNRNILEDNDVSVKLNFNNQLYHLRNSRYNNVILKYKYKDRPYPISNHFIDENGYSIVTIWGYLSKDLENMVLYVEYNNEECTLYIPAVDEKDIKEIQRKIFIEVD